MSAYYYVVAGLPEIYLDDSKLSYTVESFKSELYPLLSKDDRKVIDLFYLKFDNEALLRLLRNKDAQIEGKGNFSADELLGLIEAMKNEDEPDGRFPDYFRSFLTHYFALQPEEQEGANVGDMLAAAYYEYAMKCPNRFCADWFEFNLHVNNILAAMAARKHGMGVAQFIVGDTEVCQQLKTSNARDFGLNDMLTYFDALVKIAETDELLEREKKIDAMKWKWLDDESFFHYFTVERLFVFLLKLEMTERWIALDKEKGNELFRQLIDGLKNDVQIPQEFRK